MALVITAQVVERGSSWKTQRDFVGHKKAVSCVRFCPSMLEKMSEEVRGKNYVGQSAWQSVEKALLAPLYERCSSSHSSL